VAVGAVPQHCSPRHASFRRSAQHRDRKLGLGLKLHLVGNSRFQATGLVLCPRLRQVELEVDRQMFRRRSHSEVHADLAVGDLAGRASVLALYAHRVAALFEKASVVEDPTHYRLPFGEHLQCVRSRRSADILVSPGRIAQEMRQPLMLGVGTRRIRAGRSRPFATPWSR
jgi:hypothetical protein